jgi:hypothetical protein
MTKILIDEAIESLLAEYDMVNSAFAKDLRQALEQPAQQEPVAEVKAKMTGGNVGIATVIHEIYSPLREPLQPGDKLYSAYRWIGWDVEQVWSERIFGIDMRFENVGDAIAFRKKLDEYTTPPAPAQEPDRQELQAAGIHPAPCARHCEANAFQIAARGMRKQITELQEALESVRGNKT